MRSQILLTVDDWKLATARPTAEPDGKPIVAVDLGGGRAWSAAVAIWRNGKSGRYRACAGDSRSIEAQERRDTSAVAVCIGNCLYEKGFAPDVAEGLRVQPPAQLWAVHNRTLGNPRIDHL